MNDMTRSKIEQAFSEGSSHIRTIERATSKLSLFFPLTEKTFQSLTDDRVETLDQFIYRFTKLQDAIGQRLFPPLTTLILGSDEARPYIDILNTLEKFELIPSALDWQSLRNLRNNLAHEYPGNARQTVETLNILYQDWRVLREILKTCKSYYQKKLQAQP